MAFKDPKAITEVATEKGIEKAHLPWDKQLVAGFLDSVRQLLGEIDDHTGDQG